VCLRCRLKLSGPVHNPVVCNKITSHDLISFSSHCKRNCTVLHEVFLIFTPLPNVVKLVQFCLRTMPCTKMQKREPQGGFSVHLFPKSPLPNHSPLSLCRVVCCRFGQLSNPAFIIHFLSCLETKHFGFFFLGQCPLEIVNLQPSSLCPDWTTFLDFFNLQNPTSWGEELLGSQL